MGRVSRLTPASRALVDLVSVVPGRAELELVDSVLRPSEEAASEAEAAGVIVLKENALTFRHELARRSVETDLPQIKRREINLEVLRAVEDLGYDVSRAAHHARVGGDVDALVRLAPSLPGVPRPWRATARPLLTCEPSSHTSTSSNRRCAPTTTTFGPSRNTSAVRSRGPRRSSR